MRIWAYPHGFAHYKFHIVVITIIIIIIRKSINAA